MFSEVQESISEKHSTLTTSLTLKTSPTTLSAVPLTQPKLLYTSPNTAVLTQKGGNHHFSMSTKEQNGPGAEGLAADTRHLLM